MPDLTLGTLIKSFKEEIAELGEELEPQPGLTKKVAPLERNGKIVLYRVRGWVKHCVSGVLSKRERLYRVLGVGSDAEAYSRLLEACSNPSKPVEKSFENFYALWREQLSKLPFVKFYPGDGGRYLTSSIVVACLDEVCNASVHRVMLVDERRLVVRIVPRHLYKLYREAMAKGIDLPVAIVVGAPPQLLVAAASSPPFGVFELEVANTISELEVCRTPIHSLPIPCRASVVIEGRLVNERAREGPFVDVLGLYDRVREEPVIVVDGVYVGEELSHIIVPAGAEHGLLQSFYREAMVWDSVRRVVPRVCSVRIRGGSWLTTYVSIEKQHDGDGKLAMAAAMAAHPSSKIVVVLDCDVDLDDLEGVEWAIATRIKPRESVVVIPRARCSSLDPVYGDEPCDKLGIDATVPIDERGRFRRVEV